MDAGNGSRLPGAAAAGLLWYTMRDLMREAGLASSAEIFKAIDRGELEPYEFRGDAPPAPVSPQRWLTGQWEGSSIVIKSENARLWSESRLTAQAKEDAERARLDAMQPTVASAACQLEPDAGEASSSRSDYNALIDRRQDMERAIFQAIAAGSLEADCMCKCGKQRRRRLDPAIAWRLGMMRAARERVGCCNWEIGAESVRVSRHDLERLGYVLPAAAAPTDAEKTEKPKARPGARDKYPVPLCKVLRAELKKVGTPESQFATKKQLESYWLKAHPIDDGTWGGWRDAVRNLRTKKYQ